MDIVKGWWCVRYGDALKCVEASSAVSACGAFALSLLAHAGCGWRWGRVRVAASRPVRFVALCPHMAYGASAVDLIEGFEGVSRTGDLAKL